MDFPLNNWTTLNFHIVQASEAECLDLFKREMAGEKRKKFLQRIHSRLIRVRADRERTEILMVLEGNLKAKDLKWAK